MENKKNLKLGIVAILLLVIVSLPTFAEHMYNIGDPYDYETGDIYELTNIAGDKYEAKLEDGEYYRIQKIDKGVYKIVAKIESIARDTNTKDTGNIKDDSNQFVPTYNDPQVIENLEILKREVMSVVNPIITTGGGILIFVIVLMVGFEIIIHRKNKENRDKAMSSLLYVAIGAMIIGGAALFATFLWQTGNELNTGNNTYEIEYRA